MICKPSKLFIYVFVDSVDFGENVENNQKSFWHSIGIWGPWNLLEHPYHLCYISSNLLYKLSHHCVLHEPSLEPLFVHHHTWSPMPRRLQGISQYWDTLYIKYSLCISSVDRYSNFYVCFVFKCHQFNYLQSLLNVKEDGHACCWWNFQWWWME